MLALERRPTRGGRKRAALADASASRHGAGPAWRGLCLLLGIEARLGALLLSLFLIPVTVMYHPFWKRSGADFVVEADHFLSNLAIIGGLLLIVALGGGPISLIDHSLAQLLKDMAAPLGVAR
jgi:hypothetical protein